MSSDTNRQSFTVWLRRITSCALALSFVFVFISILQLAVIPAKYLWVILPLLAAVTLGIIWLLLSPRRLTKQRNVVIIAALAALLTGINVYGLVVLRTTGNLLGGIQASRDNYVNYVLVTSQTHTTAVESANSVVLIKTDPLYDKVYAALQDETNAERKPIEYLAELKNSLTNGSTDLAAIREETLGIIQEQDPTFFKSLVVLKTFKVEGAASSAQLHVDATKPFVLYISGIDSYGELSTVSRSDVNILAAVNPKTRSILLVTTPRDYYVRLSGTAGLKDKLTHAGLYGIDTSRQTIADLYGIQIPYYVRINFSSLVTIVDVVGPISAYSDYDFKSYHQGYNELNSKQALEFARERYSFEEGDRQRGRNQQYIIEAIMAKMSTPSNAVKIPAITSSLKNAVDTNISEDSLKTLLRSQLNDLRPWQVNSISVDGSGAMLPTYSYGNQPLYVMLPDETSLLEARQQLTNVLQD